MWPHAHSAGVCRGGARVRGAQSAIPLSVGCDPTRGQGRTTRGLYVLPSTRPAARRAASVAGPAGLKQKLGWRVLAPSAGVEAEERSAARRACARKTRPVRPAGSALLPVGRGWPRPEAALSLAWRWRVVCPSLAGGRGGRWPWAAALHRARRVEIERCVDAGQHPIEVDVGVARDARGVRRVRGTAADGARLVLQGVEDPPHLGMASTAMVSGAMGSRWSHGEWSHGGASYCSACYGHTCAMAVGVWLYHTRSPRAASPCGSTAGAAARGCRCGSSSSSGRYGR